MPTFLYPWLAIAGAAAAAVPLIVHLLNRRRFRVVHWAAMDFLREAIHRSRRYMELRDLLLLLLRVLCLLVFGVAMARPYWSRVAQPLADPNQPVHAVVLVDNSLSMSYEKFDGILLDDAKAKGRELIEGLPPGSLISVVPACGSAAAVSYAPCRRKEDALEALAAIGPVDRAARPEAVIDLAMDLFRVNMSMPLRRLYLVTDQQVAGWSAEAVAGSLDRLPCPMQIVQVSPEEIDNAWVADVQVRDGLADGQTPAVIVAKIGYQGPRPRNDVEVTLKVEGVAVTSRKINLQPGQVREVEFPEYRFTAPGEPGKTNYAAVEVSIAHDRLPGDDQRYLVVPVSRTLPVVFIDPVGTDETPARRGDTYWLRRLLAPRTDRPGREESLIEIRHVKPDQAGREMLADARLVIVAGVAEPKPELVALLREYVEQGGNVLLAAGGRFDPAAWTSVAWKEGQGILPAPLEPTCVGRLRDDLAAGGQMPFVLSFDSLQDPCFWPEGVGAEELRSLLGPPTFFFKVAKAVCGQQVEDQAAAAALGYFQRERQAIAEIDAKLAALDNGKSSPLATSPDSPQRAELQRRRAAVRPAWLAWRKGDLPEVERTPMEELARRARPYVMGRYDNDVPMFVRRRWGQGQVLFLSTSLSPQWTTMPNVGQSWWLMDRVVRGLLAETLPVRNLAGEGRFELPVAPGESGARFTLIDPDGHSRELSVDALSGERSGLSFPPWTRRGIYRVRAARPGDGTASGEDSRLWEIALAVNGPVEESELSVDGKNAAAGRSFVNATANAFTASPLEVYGVNLWKWLIGMVLVLLLAEMLLAARSTRRPEVAK